MAGSDRAGLFSVSFPFLSFRCGAQQSRAKQGWPLRLVVLFTILVSWFGSHLISCPLPVPCPLLVYSGVPGTYVFANRYEYGRYR